MKKLRQWRGLLFVLPSLIGVILFYAYPFFSSLLYCFTSGIANRHFVGLQNFKKLVHNSAYKLAVHNTLLIMGLGLAVLCSLSLILALVIEKHLTRFRFLQGWILLPLAIPAASMNLIWQDLFFKGGIMDTLLQSHVGWLQSAAAPYVMIGIIVWKNLGYDVLLIVSNLLTLPKEYEEAAEIEGAGSFCIALHVKLPQLVPMLFFTVIISLMNAFKIFREIFLLEGNYPDQHLYILQHFMNNNFENLNYEMLATAAFVLYIVIFILIFFVTKWQAAYTAHNG